MDFSNLSRYDYALPAELIRKEPLEPRDGAARIGLVHRTCACSGTEAPVICRGYQDFQRRQVGPSGHVRRICPSCALWGYLVARLAATLER